MSGIAASTAIFSLIVLIGGVVIGVVVVVAIASRREDRLFSLTREAPDAMCRGVRRFTGVWTRGDWPDEQGSGRITDRGPVSR